MGSPLEKASELTDAVSRAVSVAHSKKEFIGKQIVNGVLLFIILLVFGCLDFVNLSFHFEYLANLGYWSTVISKVIAGVCAFNIGINVMWETELKKDTVLAEAIVLYEKLIKYKQVDFEYFVTKVFNPAEKKKAYVAEINREIYRLNKFSRKRDRLLYSSEIPDDAEDYEKKRAELYDRKSQNKYCIKRKELEELKSDEYINKNLESLNVHYHEVDPAVFELEVDGSSSYRGLKTIGSVRTGKIRASTNVVLGMVGVSMFLTAIGLDMNQEEFVDNMTAFAHYLLKCAEDVGIVAWQFLRGMLRTRNIISSELTQVYVGRNQVLTQYLEWRLNTNQPMSKSYLEIHKDDDAETIELTEEQLKQFTNPQHEEKAAN